jgi:hypothetical protein
MLEKKRKRKKKVSHKGWKGGLWGLLFKHYRTTKEVKRANNHQTK